MSNIEILEMERKNYICSNNITNVTAVIEAELGKDLATLKQMNYNICKKYQESVYSAKGLLGKSDNFTTITEYAWTANRDDLHTLAEKCIRRLHDMDVLSYIYFNNKDITSAQYFGDVFKNYLCSLEVLWAMETSEYLVNDEDKKVFNYLKKIANYYLAKTTKYVRLIELNTTNERKLAVV